MGQNVHLKVETFGHTNTQETCKTHVIRPYSYVGLTQVFFKALNFMFIESS